MQEIILLAERIKSRKAGYSCPVRRLTQEEWDKPQGGDLPAVLIKLHPPSSVTQQPLSAFVLPSAQSTTKIIKYDLSTLFATIIRPPSVLRTGVNPISSSSLVEEAQSAIEDCLGLLERRRTRGGENSATSLKELEVGAGRSASNIEEKGWIGYGIGHGKKDVSTVLDGQKDILPLLVALWRLRLWSGEGWE